MIFHFRNNVTLIGGGECSRETFEEALKIAPTLLAADAGADRALGWGRVPERVIGDMDSLSPAGRAALSPGRLVAIAGQDDTDFDKALARIDAPLILGLGFLGERLDHSLASLSGLVRAARPGCLLVGAHEVCFHLTGPVGLALPPGAVLSLFPLARMRVWGQGLEWPLDGLELAPDGRIGTSNRVDASGRVSLRADGPGLVVMAPRGALAAVVRAISRPETP